MPELTSACQGMHAHVGIRRPRQVSPDLGAFPDVEHWRAAAHYVIAAAQTCTLARVGPLVARVRVYCSE